MRLALVSAATVSDSATQLVDAIWAAARPEHGLEHVSVKFRQADVAIGIFTASDRDERTVRALLERVCEMSPLLVSWKVTGIHHLPLSAALPDDSP